MSITATLKIQLLANDVIVAESDDSALWQRTLGSISALNSGKSLVGLLPSSAEQGDGGLGGGAGLVGVDPFADLGLGGDKVAAFAKELSLPKEAVLAACHPTTESPYIELDSRYWEVFKKNMPKRGPGGVAPIQLAGTLLALWAKHAGFGPPSVGQAQEVLATIHLRDPNAYRGLENCDWLQRRGSSIVINPVEFSRATAVVQAYCLKKAVPDGQ